MLSTGTMSARISAYRRDANVKKNSKSANFTRSPSCQRSFFAHSYDRVIQLRTIARPSVDQDVVRVGFLELDVSVELRHAYDRVS